MRPRIRTIKPEAFTDEDLWDLEERTGLPIFRAFVGLWTVADREGRFEWRPRALKAAILPYWEGDFSRVLDALTTRDSRVGTRGFVRRYTVDGREYGVVSNFTKHQSINNREEASVLPSPDEADPETPDDPVTSTRDARVPDASSTREERVPHAGKGEGKGTEGNGREGNHSLSAAEPPQRGKPRPEVVEVFEHWRSKLGKGTAAKLDDKRRKRIVWALDAYGLDAVKRCIDGYAASDWHRGANDRGRAYDDLTLWLRDAEHVERGIAMADESGGRRGARLTPAAIDPDSAAESRRKAAEVFGPLTLPEVAHG